MRRKQIKQSNRRQLTSPPVRSSQWVLPIFVVEQNLLGFSAVMLLVFYRRLGIYIKRHWPLYENMTSYTKPEVHNISQRRQRRTEPRPQATSNMHKNWWSSAARFSSYASGQTNRQTHKQTYSLQYFIPDGGEVIIQRPESSNYLLKACAILFISFNREYPRIHCFTIFKHV